MDAVAERWEVGNQDMDGISPVWCHQNLLALTESQHELSSFSFAHSPTPCIASPFPSDLVSALQESPPSALPFLVVSRHIWHVQLDFDLPCEPGRNITSSLKLMRALIDS